MFTKRVTLIVSAGFVTGLIIAACDFSEPEPTHCARSTGDSVCADRYGSDRPYCTIPSCDASGEGYYGCVAEKPTDECNYACGGHRNILDDGSCLTAGDGDGDGDGDPTGDGDGDGDGDQPCMGPEDCTDPGAPFCDTDSGECVTCDATAEPDASCAEFDDGSTPVCLDGSCVQCAEGKVDACSGTTPVCDVGASMCVGCSEHAQCPESGACNFAAGNCIDPGSVKHVDGGADNCPGANGTEAMPYCTIASALAATGAEAVIVLHALDGQVEYTETVSISKPVAIFPMVDEAPLMRAAGANPSITVNDQGVLLLNDITIQSGQSDGIRIDLGGMAWIDQSVVDGNDTLGVNITGGAATIRRSKIVNNTGGGIVVEGGGMLALENSFVGGDINDQAAVSIDDGTATVVYSTLAAGALSATALTCEADGTATVRNSLLVARTDGEELACLGATYSASAVEMTDVPGTVSLGPLPAMPSEWFTAYTDGDFFLAPTHPPAIDTAAKWQIGDPATDIDGTARPTTDGADDYAGADIPQ